MHNAANTNRKKLKTMKQVPWNIASKKLVSRSLAYLYKAECVTFVLTKQQITLLCMLGSDFSKVELSIVFILKDPTLVNFVPMYFSSIRKLKVYRSF